MSFEATTESSHKTSPPKPAPVKDWHDKPDSGKSDKPNELKASSDQRPEDYNTGSDNKLGNQSWMQSTLNEARSLWSGNWNGSGNDSKPLVQNVSDVGSLEISNIWNTQGNSAPKDSRAVNNDTTTATASAARPSDSGGVWGKVSGAFDWMETQIGLKPTEQTTDSKSVDVKTNQGHDSSRGRSEIKANNGKVTADGETAHGQNVHAEIDKNTAHVQLENGPIVDVDHAKKSGDYRSPSDGEWQGHFQDGKGVVTNTKNGEKITYDGKEFVAQDRNGQVVARSNDPEKLELRLKDLDVQVGPRTAEQNQQKAKEAQKSAQETGDGRVKAFRDQDGDWAIANHDALIKTNHKEHYVEITGKDGRTVRVRRDENGQNHFNEVSSDGKEQDMSDQQRVEFAQQSGLKLDSGSGRVGLRSGQVIVDSSGNVRPTDSSVIDSQTGDMSAKNESGGDISIKTNPLGQPQVQSGDFNWTPGDFQAKGSDGSSVDITGQGADFKEPNGIDTNMGWNGTVDMTDQFNQSIFNQDADGNKSLWDGTNIDGNGDLSNLNDNIFAGAIFDNSHGDREESYGGRDYAYGYNNAEEESPQEAAADIISDSASGQASAAVGFVQGQEANVVLPESDTVLAGAEASLNGAMDICLAAHDFDGVPQVSNMLSVVASKRSEIAARVNESYRLLADGISTSGIAEAQRMTGYTPEGAVDKIEREYRPELLQTA